MSEKTLPGDILGQILVRLDLKDLIQCNRVCKSWHSLISTSRFSVSIFKRSNTNYTKRRIVIEEDPLRKHLVGSSNGLICIFTRNEIIVLNPLTIEFKKLENPDEGIPLRSHPSFLRGFGYDSSLDDYKVIIGRQDYKEDLTRFHVLSLKSHVWKVVTELKYTLIRNSWHYEKDGSGGCGILYDGALHWFVLDPHKNPVILSFDLSTEEFKEIPQPDDQSYKNNAITNYCLGMVEESLCIFEDTLISRAQKEKRGRPKWVMRNYDGKQCWEWFPHDARWDNDVALRLKMLTFYNRVKKSFFHKGKQCILETLEYISAPIYVQSLVSPQVSETPKSPVSPDVNGRAKRLVSHHVNRRSMRLGHVSQHVIGGLKRKRHSQNGFREL